MTVDELGYDSLQVAQDIANHSIGFCKIITQGNQEDAVPAGSGTLVTIGKVHGILTAAHVVEHIRKEPEIGLIRFPNQPNKVQKLKLTISDTDAVILRGPTFGPTRPDLALLRLPPTTFAVLLSTNSFLNIGALADTIRHGQAPATPFIDAVMGVVGEWTQDMSGRHPSLHLKTFQLLFGAGKLVSQLKVHDFDLCSIAVSFKDGVKPPASYGGMSGGGLWRVYFDNKITVERRLVGVAFYEYDDTNGHRLITCHGPQSIYTQLIGAARQKWPHETASTSEPVETVH